MKVERANQLLPLFKHFAGGGEIQSAHVIATTTKPDWRDNDDPQWCDDCLYRKKPELVHGFVNVYPDDFGDIIYPTYDRAEKNATKESVIRIGVEVQEVVK